MESGHGILAELYGREGGTMNPQTPANAWLSPRGVLYPCGRGGHLPLACRYYRNASNPQCSMEDAGWWKLSDLFRGKAQWMGTRPATTMQQESIRRWTQRWNRQAEKCLVNNLRPMTVKLPDFRGI